MAQTAEALRTAALELVLEPGLSEAELTRRYADRVAGFMPMIGPMLEYMARLHLRQSVRTEAINAAERQAGALPGARDVTVCFADLVGFTRLGEQVAPDELGRVAHRLVELTAERLRGAVRLVKTIGDAAMLVGPDAAAMLEPRSISSTPPTPRATTSRSCASGSPPAPRSAARGDWYGRPVNLASRVTAIARPGSVLATREVRDAATDAYRWSSAGARSLKGVEGPVRLYRARRLTRDDEDAEAARERYRPPAPTAGSDDPAAVGTRGGRSGAGASGCGRRRRRTDGCASQASAPARPTALMPSSVSCRPTASAIGPHTAMPSGMRPMETLKS